MNIILYQSRAEMNRVNKDAFITEKARYKIVLKQPTSIVNPSVLLKLESTDSSIVNVQVNGQNVQTHLSQNIVVNSEFELYQCNYAYIDELHRYYFITDIISTSKDLFELRLHCDVLMSFRDEIKNLECYVERNEWTFDKDLQDNEMTIKSDVNVEFTEIENDLFGDDDPNGRYYVTTLVSQGGGA